MRFGLFAALSPSLLISVAAAAQPDVYVVCMSRNRENTAGYASSVITLHSGNPSDVELAWRKMTTEKYQGFPSSTGCSRATTSSGAETIRSRYLDQLGDEGIKVTNVAWSYSREKAVVAAPAAPKTPAQAALAEMSAAQGYCQYNMQHMRELFDCGCFSKMVYKHRLAFGPETIRDGTNREGVPRPIPQLLLPTPTKLDVAECLTDQHIAIYVDEMLDPGPYAAASMNAAQKAKLTGLRACTKKLFAQKIRSEPYASVVQKDFNLAQIECSGSKP